jgi:hypothetical protein
MRTFTGETATCAIHERSFTRAAGVSPPSCVKPTPRRENRALFSNLRNDHQNRRGQPAVVRESCRQHRAFVAERGCSDATGGLRPPLLVVLWCGHLPTKLRLVRYTNARLQERRPSARGGSGIAPANTGRLLPNEDAHMPRGAYAPRSCVGVRMSASEIAIFAMHKRTFYRSGGR